MSHSGVRENIPVREKRMLYLEVGLARPHLKIAKKMVGLEHRELGKGKDDFREEVGSDS